jgi:hypothetical protein
MSHHLVRAKPLNGTEDLEEEIGDRTNTVRYNICYTTKIDYSHNYFILKEKIGLDF